LPENITQLVSALYGNTEKLSGSKAQCKLCSKQLMCVGGSMSGLRHHLLRSCQPLHHSRHWMV